MKERIQNFIDYKNVTPGELADILEVQRSNISHILNGRNMPGASFIQKFLAAFPDINARWLLTGEGEMINKKENNLKVGRETNEVQSEPQPVYNTAQKPTEHIFKSSSKKVDKVILLYNDGSFLIYD